MSLSEVMSIMSIVCGWISFIGVCSYAIPQFIRIIKTKNTSSMAITTYIMFMVSASLILAWAIGNVFYQIDTGKKLTTVQIVLTLLPSITLNVLNYTLNLISFVIKIKHLRMCKKLKVDELELAKILLKQKNKKGRK